MNDKTPSDLPSGLQAESPNQEKFASRLRSKREEAGFTQQDLATKIGVSLTSIQNYEAGRIPRGEHLIALSRELSCSIDWILTGSTSLSTPKGSQEPAPAPAEDVQSRGYTLVPKVKARLNAGTGSLETSAETIGHYAFKTQFLKRKGNSTRMVLMDIHGDSMEPVLEDQDTVLIDESQNEILSGCMFAVGVDNEVFVKYVDREPGMLILRSRNERYKPIEVPMTGDLADGIRIIGRVVWSCREYGG